uniref:GTPase n=1 Tax=uncultured Allobacillus sp. TaxID=1638025 RepID=UPI002593CE7B|nr:GTPase [uncultured Allobacillus sp.]
MNKDRQVIEERLEQISNTLETAADFTTNILDELDIEIPEVARKQIINIIHSEEIKQIVNDIQTRRPPRIVLMGRSGVGKSSLINAMFGAYLAETSAVEVGTVEHEFFQYTKNGQVLFEIIDTRGIKENINQMSHSAEEDLNVVIEEFQPDAFLFLTNGADRSTLKKDAEDLKEIFNRMSIKPPLITVITRMDELEPSRLKDPSKYTDQKIRNFKQKERQVEYVLHEVGLTHSFIVPISAYIEWDHEDPESLTPEEREQLSIAFDGRYNIDELFNVLEDNIDFNAVIDLMFNYRIDLAIEKIAKVFVQRFSAAGSAVGLSPMPVADILVLLPIQIAEVILIAHLGGTKIDGKSAREFILSLGAVSLFGFGLRFVAQQGAKLLNVVPGAGSAISGAIAYSGTYSVGKAAIAYYVKGNSLEEAKKEAEAAKEEIETPVSEQKVEAELKEEPAQDEKREVVKEKKKLKINKQLVKDTLGKVKTKLPKRKK